MIQVRPVPALVALQSTHPDLQGLQVSLGVQGSQESRDPKAREERLVLWEMQDLEGKRWFSKLFFSFPKRTGQMFPAEMNMLFLPCWYVCSVQGLVGDQGPKGLKGQKGSFRVVDFKGEVMFSHKNCLKVFQTLPCSGLDAGLYI